MRKTQIFEYYAFGYDTSFLCRVSAGLSVHGGNGLVGRLKTFLDTLEELDLHVTKQAASNLRAIRDKAGELPKDAKVDDALAREARTAVSRLDVTLDAELELRSAYVVTPKRLQLEYLLEKPQRLFASGVYDKLPAICQYDFAEAGKCIAFGLPTAAAFHLMRGTEGALRDYYCSIVKRGHVKRLMWNAMIQHLRSRRDAPPAALMDNLDSLRANFRNPTQHPEARHDLDGAQDLLGVAVDAVNRMMKDLDGRSA